ncbi:hypothetical protein BCR33DRAFT_713803 [Rhizoclosmatium globosum]|uniref:DM13 domain-containing protein n=1 Tax=Rhizoclosmatium globosum TaxID=329046 RepID=A0A1Y2CRB2_9FUNG|nr:hypothetical protein BCR33DRAFT_713803 [Rhizoclosmatium globosum]|eukprot:ORY49496.1 hypothetical protein BCR33DRAFT_713803 [Rhizoclosmatium globosum]
MQFLATVLAASSVVLAVQPQVKFCQKGTLPAGWEPGKVTAPLQQVSQFLIANTAIDLVCSGNIVVLDGCSFMVQGFTYTDPSPSTWYAGLGDDPTGVVFSKDSVGTSNGVDSPVYTLVQVVGAAYAWTSITQLRLYDPANTQLICVANLPAAGSTSSTTNTNQVPVPASNPSTSGKNTSTGSTENSGSTSGTTSSSSTGNTNAIPNGSVAQQSNPVVQQKPSTATRAAGSASASDAQSAGLAVVLAAAAGLLV